MPKIELINPAQIPPYSDGPLYPRGHVAEVSEEVASKLEEFGLVAKPEAGSGGKPEPKAASEPVAEAEPDAATPKPAAAGKPQRPKQAASTAVWREYAEALGLKVNGLSKPEIIGAVDAAK